MKIDNAIKNAINWFLSMQVRSGNFKGGFLSGINFGWLSHVPPFIYSEISGYGLKMLLNLSRDGEHHLMERVMAAAGFLLKVQCNEGAFAHGVLHPQNSLVDTYYTFDTAICTSALLDLYKVYPNEEFLDSSKKAGYWLVKMAQNDDGSFKSKYDGHGNFVKESKWYGDRCCLHGKNVISLLKVWENTGESLFKSSAERAADWIRSLQLPDGAFKVNDEENYIFTHAHCYATEGLLYAYYMIGESDYLSAAIRAGDWLMNVQEDDGGLLNLYGNISLISRARNNIFPVRMKPVDAVAQAIRIWMALYSLSGDMDLLESAHKAVNFLLRAQYSKGKPDLQGGFYQQLKGLFKLPVMRTWSCIFSIEALRLLMDSNQEFDEIMQQIM